MKCVVQYGECVLFLGGCLVHKVELGELGHVSSTKHSVDSTEFVLILLLLISCYVG